MKKRLLMLTLCLGCMYTAMGQPVFNGGSYALNNFLAQKIIYPNYSKQKCISGTIQVGFKLDDAGNITTAKVEDGLGIDLDDEALRVIKLTSGKWKIPPGYNTSTYIILPVKFLADPKRCTGITKPQVDVAIADYKTRQNVEDMITSYYKKKYAGTADSIGEAQIIALKRQLGFDEDFITNVLEQAQEKWEQGDKEGACSNWQFIRNIGSPRANTYIVKYCNK